MAELDNPISNTTQWADEDIIKGLRVKGESNFFFFLKEVCEFGVNPDPSGPRITDDQKELCDYLQSLYEGTQPEKVSEWLNMILAPRDTLKSTVLQGFALWVIVKNPDVRILFYGEVHEQAQKRLAVIKRVITSCKTFKLCYGNLDGSAKGLPWNENLIVTANRKNTSTREGTIETAGLDVVVNSRHFDWIFPDDLHSERNTRTKDQIENVREKVQLLMPLLTKGGKMVFAGVFWNDSDFHTRLIDEHKPNLYKRGAYTDDTELVSRYPFALPLEELKKKKKFMTGDQFSCTPAGSSMLMADWSTKPIEEVQVGDSLVGFKSVNDKWVLVPSKVLAVGCKLKPTLKVELESGNVVYCTEDHEWFTGNSEGDLTTPGRKVYRVAKVGRSLRRVHDPIIALTDQQKLDAQWLAGFFDGEGSFSTQGLITFTQSNTHNKPICDKLESVLQHLGFPFKRIVKEARGHQGIHTSETYWYYLLGPRVDVIRKFLSIVKPTKWRERMHQKLWEKRSDFYKDKVVAITKSFTRLVYSVETETGNYINQGFASKNCHYLLDPVSKESQKFKKEYFNVITDRDFNSIRTFLLIDPAGDPTSDKAEKKDSDYVGMVVVGVNSFFDICIRNMYMGRVNPTEAIEVALSFMLRYNPFIIGVERSGMGNMKHYLTEELRKKGRFAVVEDMLPAGRSKYQRILELEPLARRRKIYIAMESQHKEDFIDQITKVTNGIKSKHDDLIDPLAYILDVLKQYGIGAVDSEETNFIPPELRQLDGISKDYWMSVRKAKEKTKNNQWVNEFSSY